MDCDWIDEHLHRVLDRELAPDEEAGVAAHLSECGRCVELLRMAAAEDRALTSAMPVAPAAHDLAADILSALGDAAPPRPRITRLWLRLAAAAAVFVLAFVGYQALIERPASIIAASMLSCEGNVTARAPGATQWAAASAGQRFPVGTQLKTASRAKAVIQFGQQAKVMVNGNAASRVAESGLVIESGRVFAWVEKAGSTFFVKTPHAAAKVRGTRFNVDCREPGATVLSVVDGLVDFSNDSGRVEVGANMQSLAGPGRRPTQPLAADLLAAVSWAGITSEALSSPADVRAGAPTKGEPVSMARLREIVEQARLLMYANKAKEGAEPLRDAMPQILERGDPDLVRRALIQLAWVSYSAEMYDVSLESAQEAIRRFGTDPARSASLYHVEKFAIVSLHALGRHEETLPRYRAFLRKYGGQPRASLALTTLVDSWGSYGHTITSADEALRVYLANAGNLLVSGAFRSANICRYQERCVRMLLEAGKTAEALGEAKLYFYVTRLDGEPARQAVNLLSEALKAHDGGIHRLNTFLTYQLHGAAGPDGQVGTDDDVPNILAEIDVASTPERDRLLQEVLGRQPDDHTGHRARGYIYLFLDKPKLAVAELKKAYQLCPAEGEAVQDAIDDVALALKAYHGTALGVQKFLEFQQHGPNGPDGQKGTDDDIEDPLKGF